MPQGEAGFTFTYDPTEDNVPHLTGEYEADLDSVGDGWNKKPEKQNKSRELKFGVVMPDSDDKIPITAYLTIGVRFIDKRTKKEKAGDFLLRDMLAALGMTTPKNIAGSTQEEYVAALEEFVDQEILPVAAGQRFRVRVRREVDPQYGPKLVIKSILPSPEVVAMRQAKWTTESGANGKAGRQAFAR